MVTSQGQLLQEQVSFYQGLYNQATEEENVREAADRFMTDEHFPTLDENDNMLCEGIMSFEEATRALWLMKDDSAPGSDGLTI